MTGLQQILPVWTEWIWAVSWQFTLLVGLVAITCWLLRAASPRIRHALWLLCLVKIVPAPFVGCAVGNRQLGCTIAA